MPGSLVEGRSDNTPRSWSPPSPQMTGSVLGVAQLGGVNRTFEGPFCTEGKGPTQLLLTGQKAGVGTLTVTVEPGSKGPPVQPRACSQSHCQAGWMRPLQPLPTRTDWAGRQRHTSAPHGWVCLSGRPISPPSPAQPHKPRLPVPTRGRHRGQTPQPSAGRFHRGKGIVSYVRYPEPPLFRPLC